jgi:hypothetical protein
MTPHTQSLIEQVPVSAGPPASLTSPALLLSLAIALDKEIRKLLFIKNECFLYLG